MPAVLQKSIRKRPGVISPLERPTLDLLEHPHHVLLVESVKATCPGDRVTMDSITAQELIYGGDPCACDRHVH
jgi:hypothetical protein